MAFTYLTQSQFWCHTVANIDFMVPFSEIIVSVLKVDMQLIFKIYGQFLVLYDHEY